MQNKNMNYKLRRDRLVDLVEKEHHAFSGPIILFAPCDDPGRSFEQDSNFYYFSGIVDPATVMILENKEQIFYRPAYTDMRSKWVATAVDITEKYVESVGFDKLSETGDTFSSIHVYPYFDFRTYQHVIALISKAIAREEKIFTVYPSNSYEAIAVKAIIDRLSLVIPHFKENIVDISSLTAQLRRKKDMHELEVMYKAVEITGYAHQAAMHALQPGINESQVQASLEYVFTENKATLAYPSIVAGGVRGTILHYDMNNQVLKDGQLVVIDAGARYQYYSADITRTYPVSGKFTQEQKDLYEIVLHAQELVADQAKPGMWLSNKNEQDASLHHIAANLFKKHGYDKYFIHGIGHFLGLDVHDVGDGALPLQEGDVITIEPGIYIPEKEIGIRIEDNYWIVDQTTPVCLSEAIPKSVKSIEELVQKSFDVDL